jgi:hypothetical protein
LTPHGGRRAQTVAILATVLAIASPAAAGWAQTRWGMTAAEVQSVMPDTRPSRGEGLQGMLERSRGRSVFEGIPVETKYYYGDGGLGLVGLDIPVRRCREAVAAIIAEHGQPVRTSDQVLIQLGIWHDEDSDTRIRLLTSSAGICTLYYEPLAAYREGDLAGEPVL